MGTATTTHVNMDNLMNMGKQAYSAYQSSQAGEKRHEGDDSNPYGVTGSERLNSSDNRRPGGGISVNNDEAVQHASSSFGGNSDLFSQAMSFISQTSDDKVDEDDDDMDANGVGAAAAMQALKKFTSSGSEPGSTQSGDFKSKLIGQAMSEAAALFEKKNPSGNKEDAVTSAGQTVMKLLMKNQVSGMMGGGSEGGMGDLMGMARKFM